MPKGEKPEPVQNADLKHKNIIKIHKQFYTTGDLPDQPEMVVMKTEDEFAPDFWEGVEAVFERQDKTDNAKPPMTGRVALQLDPRTLRVSIKFRDDAPKSIWKISFEKDKIILSTIKDKDKNSHLVITS